MLKQCCRKSESLPPLSSVGFIVRQMLPLWWGKWAVEVSDVYLVGLVTAVEGKGLSLSKSPQAHLPRFGLGYMPIHSLCGQENEIPISLSLGHMTHLQAMVSSTQSIKSGSKGGGRGNGPPKENQGGVTGRRKGWWRSRSMCIHSPGVGSPGQTSLLGCLFHSHSAGNSGKSFGDMFPPEVLASCGPYSFRGTGPQK